MKQLDDLKFAEIIAKMGAVYKPLNDIQLDVYFEMLMDYSLEEIAFAAGHIMKTQRFTGAFPAIADFVQAIENKGGNSDERAELAWRILIKTMENHGYYDSVQFEDLAIGEAVKALGGWMRLNDGDNLDWYEDQLQWRRKEFINLYKNFSRQQLSGQEGRLIGCFEADNDYDVKTIFIGYDGQVKKIAPPEKHKEIGVDGIVNQVAEAMGARA